ncbi:MAG TPA: RlmI/RlmK family 23S rRNA methyltransferase, partial [Stellaceae bacterium]|nr:RlmI/RlmK family 23S rRNA methyltransferase [Stellaceae bacterium]
MEPTISATDFASIAAPSADDPGTRPTVTLLPAAKRRAETGHPWIYSNEVLMDEAARALPGGTLVTMCRADGAALGVAMFNPHSLVAARLLDRDPDRVIGTRFFGRRIERALRLRQQLFDEPFYRLVHAEADGLPGLVVERFDDVLVVQSNTAGMAQLEPLVLETLSAALKPRAIVLRNDSPARAQEGLLPEVRLAAGALDTRLLLLENGALFP